MNGQNSTWNKIKDSTRSKQRSNLNINNDGEKKKNCRKPIPRPHETEEEAILRRFHDAQRMARFRAKRKKAIEDAKALENAKLTELAMITELKRRNVVFEITNSVGQPISSSSSSSSSSSMKQQNQQQDNSLIIVPTIVGPCKYSQLLALIEELGRNIRLTYAGSRTSAERLKVGIMQARMLVRDCLLETEINSR
ncbi:hypothetical protein PV327_008397 [Microctonus hyperodae]|uniref:Uncharacterized protein n=1 Tax=Microctonus hyperodae TaxID=165561 RepID=A0AA39F321_MICHY|nr:hypothetical protein PV327_008397 [Microctonus hyperodae]